MVAHPLINKDWFEIPLFCTTCKKDHGYILGFQTLYKVNRSPEKFGICVSSLKQKAHRFALFHFRLAKLSLVRITPFFRNHKNILILSGIFSHQTFWETFVLVLIRYLYMVFTVEEPLFFRSKKIYLPLYFFFCEESPFVLVIQFFLQFLLRRAATLSIRLMIV